MEPKKKGIKDLKLLGKTVSVEFVDAIPNAPQGAVGLNNCNTLRILLLKDQADDSMKDTMLHEIIHMLDYEYQLGLKERHVHCLASGLYAVLKDNPQVTKWLTN